MVFCFRVPAGVPQDHGRAAGPERPGSADAADAAPGRARKCRAADLARIRPAKLYPARVAGPGRPGPAGGADAAPGRARSRRAADLARTLAADLPVIRP